MNREPIIKRRQARARRTHAQARAGDRMRLLVFRSNKSIYAQIVDDANDKIVCGTSGLKGKETGMAMAKAVGAAIADLAKKAKVKEVTFDRNGFAYQGQIKALADSAREAGLAF